MVRIKSFLAVILIATSFSNFATDWRFERGNVQDFAAELDKYLGVNYLFNCEILIERVQREGKLIYWMTILDTKNNNYSVLTFNGDVKNMEFEKNANGYLAFAESSQFTEKKTKQIKIKKGFDGEWAQIYYQETLLNPYLITNTTKCSAE